MKPGGAILLCASLSGGIGSASFEKLLRECASAEDFEHRLEDDRFFAIDQWMVQHLCQAHRRARVMLYTDGLPEATSPQKELFGEERMKTLLAGLQERSPDEIVSQLVRATIDWTKSEVFADDLTLVVVKGT